MSAGCGKSNGSAVGGKETSAKSLETRVLLLADTDPTKVTRPSFRNIERTRERNSMVNHQIAGEGVRNEAVLNAMRAVPRHRLVPKSLQSAAYEDRPLPIGHGQTISQPFIVGYMTEKLNLDPNDRVLEIGTGSGYQAAILGQLVRDVVTIEIIGALAERAAADLQALGYRNITVLHQDGYYGYEAKAPYDAIIVTAAATHVPPPLIQQLKPGGIMMIPVGESGWTQNLLLVKKNEEGDIVTRTLLPVRFVPFTREK